MIWKIVLVLGVAAGVHGDEDAVSEQRVIIHHPKHAAVIAQTEDKQENHKDYAWSYPSYEFSYKVKDPHTHDIKGQKEERDGDKVKGDYWLIEPTGRKRTVKYHANDDIGFNAQVDYSKNEKGQNNQVQNGRSNSQNDGQLQEQRNGNGYKVTEGNNKENENEKIELENSGVQNGNTESENREENGGNNLIEQTENNNNQGPVSDAMVTLAAENENNDPQNQCICNDRRQDLYRSNINEVNNNNNGGQGIATRKKRKNNNRSIKWKSGDEENLKHVEEGEKKYNRKSNQSDLKKNNQNENLNNKNKKNESVNFGARNGKRKPTPTDDQNKHDKKSENNVKIEELKESESIDQNDNDQKYQHRIVIHHPKAVFPTAKKN